MDRPRAYDAYQELADAYAARIDTKPHNAYCDRPAVMGMWPDVRGRRVFDAGCGPGAYTAQLIARGAQVIAGDVSERMLELAGERLQGAADLRLMDLSRPLDGLADASFDLVNAPLCLDYIADWRAVFAEFRRILRPGGVLVYSCGHPAFDAEYFDTAAYYEVEPVECLWTGFGVDVSMPSYRRPLEEIVMPVLDAGLILERLHEPRPTSEFEDADPERYRQLMHRPIFVCVRAGKPL